MSQDVRVPVPFHGWSERTRSWRADVLDVMARVSRSDAFILKDQVALLERRIAAEVGVRHAVACGGGTGALQLGLLAHGIGAGDDVITPAYSFIASASTIALVGARPVFADVDEETATLAPTAVAAALKAAERPVRAILPAHLFCNLADMAGLRGPADEHGALLIEDSAISLGAAAAGRPAGGLGDLGVLSFFPGKPLGGIGDGGMVLTDDDEVAGAVRELRNHGQDSRVRFLYHRVGINSRMDEVTAAFLLRRLDHFDGVLRRRRALAERYQERLRTLAPALRTPPDGFAERSVYTYAVRAEDRDALRAFLLERGIETMVHYPRPLPLQPVFRHLGHAPGDFPVAERLAATVLALPLHEEMDPGTVDRVAAEIARFYGARP
ncbi:DegT/DnrJ/EryC1/StrS family aminotransferase [Streptomyces sp. NPDC050856]|uniref:DegT/DnrJ/EryC1/StrS family aminotransferase n=1 Tax=Streptomyces sp. NPDC050856 TaxID=3154939 RepID=UPI0033D62C59